MPPHSRATRRPPWPYGEPHPDRTLCGAPSDCLLPLRDLYSFWNDQSRIVRVASGVYTRLQKDLRMPVPNLTDAVCGSFIPRLQKDWRMRVANPTNAVG